ncbi:hypothetical protein IV102_30010 [bacterium]|nr:hypothetical protein [bacterium]
MKHTRGLSLLEAVFALFVLLSAFLVVINLFHSGLGHSARLEKQQMAALVADRYLEQMRLWSETRTGTTYNYETLAAVYGARSESIQDYTEFAVSTQVSPITLGSACSHFEMPTPPLPLVNATTNFPMGSRQLPASNGSAQSVHLTITWDNNSHRIDLQTYLCRPIPNPRALNPIVITPQAATPYVVGSGALLPHGDTGAGLNLTATAFDIDGQAIPDVFFEWDVLALQGNGTMVQSRDGSLANVTNLVQLNGSPHFTGGNISVVVGATIHGRKVLGTFGPIELEP